MANLCHLARTPSAFLRLVCWRWSRRLLTMPSWSQSWKSSWVPETVLSLCSVAGKFHVNTPVQTVVYLFKVSHWSFTLSLKTFFYCPWTDVSPHIEIEKLFLVCKFQLLSLIIEQFLQTTWQEKMGCMWLKFDSFCQLIFISHNPPKFCFVFFYRVLKFYVKMNVCSFL